MDAYTLVTIVIFAASFGGEVSGDSELEVGFSVKPEDMMVDLNTFVSLPCRVVGTSMLFWTKNATNVIMAHGMANHLPSNAESRYHVDSNGSLRIKNTTKEDSGLYKCVAVYPNNAIYAKAFLKVFDMRLPRYPPSEVKAVKIANKFIAVSWVPPKMADDQSPISGFNVILRERSTNIPKVYIYNVTAGQNYVVILREDANRYYTVEVAAANEYGTGPHSTPVRADWISFSSMSIYLWKTSKPNITHVNDTHVTVEWMPMTTYNGKKINYYTLQVLDETRTRGRRTDIRVTDIRINNATVMIDREYPIHRYHVRAEVDYRNYSPWTKQAYLNTAE